MRGVGGDVGHGVKFAPGQRLIQAGKAVGDAVPVTKGAQLFGAGVHTANQRNPFDFLEFVGMVRRHAAGAKDQDADGLYHQRSPASPS